ncbi:hypothetical protein BCR44DRAFT_33639 [Catenaria anguillulae PL171]|uniref:Uncharacterized protein n=1 Tax=Catenaria anguillulae PL171 TaxID=765915 RepID=A0A1Y2HJN0_9FUNG|nr:hypothetical protein BCR44DRAFT_33639 [Catenaria anguillulae PL171]
MDCPPQLPASLTIATLTLVLVTHVPVHFLITRTSDGCSPWHLSLASVSTVSALAAASLVVPLPSLAHCPWQAIVPHVSLAGQALLSLVVGAGYLYYFPVHMRSPPPLPPTNTSEGQPFAAAAEDEYWMDVGPKPMSVARRGWWRMALGMARDVGWCVAFTGLVVGVVLGIGNKTLAHVCAGGFGVMATLLVIVQHANVLDDAWHGYARVGDQEDEPREWGASLVWAVKIVVDTGVVWSVASVMRGGIGVAVWASLAMSAVTDLGVLVVRALKKRL